MKHLPLVTIHLLGLCGLLVSSGCVAPSGEPDAGPRCEATAVTCQDESIQQLKLHDTVNDGGVTEVGTASGEFTTHLDARAGGAATPQSYVYGRFASSGLVKVDVSDEAAFTSLDWDIAVRRYVIRLNSGVSGPSCVAAAGTAVGTTFESLTRVPSDLTWNTEQYFSGTCEYVADNSGIGAPGTVLSGFWTYEACVQMTHNIYVVHLRDGRYVKLQVLSYYDPAAQSECNSTGTAPIPNGAANLRIRWAFIDGPKP